MSTPPVFSISRSRRQPSRVSANILPCKIHHDGQVNASKRYWDPRKGDDGSLTAHFRGRRLKGKALKIPKGYKAVTVRPSSKAVKDGSLKAEMIAEFEHQSQDTDFMARRDEEEHLQAAIRQGSYDTSDLQLMREVSELGEIVVWGHDEVPDAISDSYSKGIEEWIAMAHAMHQTNGEQQAS